MAGVYRPRHPERTALYRVLFHYFDQCLTEYESRFEKQYGFLRCGGTMKIIAFITDYAVVDSIVNHLKLTFVAERLPPPHLVYQEVLTAAEAGAEY